MKTGEPWKLRRTSQCDACPWRVATVPDRDIPRYDREKHVRLSSTIADATDTAQVLADLASGERRIMQCHATERAHCVGWLHNQTGAGSNIPLRVDLGTCTNFSKLRLRGKQHPTFEDTIPE